ncbi:DUF2528 family protein [Polaromonas sp. P2-4]|nr:DUF2528 family protein [Polaromonas sp. P2-4]
MSQLKTFMVCSEDNAFQVVLEVNLEKLTPAMATEVNNFWGGNEARADLEDGDVVRAVIRLYGSRMIAMMLAAGGVHFDQETNPEWAEQWTKQMQQLEGWPGPDGTPNGALGIRVLVAEVVVPGFEEVELSEVRVP